ncbi:hypothetical protein FA10DRAFT_269542 [Acaromyces ingoldii]|uniref:Uncharacterized protein n=1 Tax=Acaromyces ingoldii TaxID=215250 RepID=A0A316YEE8_9BASI|nr:hypothetical protein FA10DRAFT_269542 [Acaromyces ingoldii]PWN87589.1 hypothetical protein FA10DRAFT_269542 [Acaromyces ingoldii]
MDAARWARAPPSSRGTTITFSPTPSPSPSPSPAPGASQPEAGPSRPSPPSSTSSTDEDLADAPSPTSRRSDSPTLPPTNSSRASRAKELKEYKKLVKEMQEQEASDLAARLAQRAYLERLAVRFWSACIIAEREAQQKRKEEKRRKRSRSSLENEVEEHEEGERGTEEEQDWRRIKATICRRAAKSESIRHRSAAFRWPVHPSKCDVPPWTFGDEIVGIMERAIRRTRTSDEPPDAAIAMPTVALALDKTTAILDWLADGRGHDSQEDPADWTDVLHYLEDGDHGIPTVVTARVRERLLDIYGERPGNLGAQRLEQVLDGLFRHAAGRKKSLGPIELMAKRAVGEPSSSSSATIRRRPRTSCELEGRGSNRKIQREADAMLLLEPSFTKRARYLELPPVDRQRSTGITTTAAR